MKSWPWPAAAVLLLANEAPAPGPAPIAVTVSGVRSDAGQVVVNVCPESSFLHACPYTATAPAHAGSVMLEVGGVPPGRYAIQAYHDANANGDLDRGIFGIPKEGIGFSNDAMRKLVRPKFAAAAFDHAREPQQLAVMLHYFLN